MCACSDPLSVPVNMDAGVVRMALFLWLAASVGCTNAMEYENVTCGDLNMCSIEANISSPGCNITTNDEGMTK